MLSIIGLTLIIGSVIILYASCIIATQSDEVGSALWATAQITKCPSEHQSLPLVDSKVSGNNVESLITLVTQITAVIERWDHQDDLAHFVDQELDELCKQVRVLEEKLQELCDEEPTGTHPILAGMREEDLIPLVEECLKSLDHFAKLGKYPLAELQIVKSHLASQQVNTVTSLDQGKALREVLLQVLDKIRPQGEEPEGPKPPPREWHQFIVLRDSYVQSKMNNEIMSRLDVADATFFRLRRRAINSLTRTLWEMEQQTKHK